MKEKKIKKRENVWMYGEVRGGVGGGKRSKSPKVQGFQGPGVPRSQGPKDQDISNSHSNTSLTLKKVHLVSQ